MNIKGHIVGEEKVTIYGPADIEVHKGFDGRLYMLDFARYMPPEPPNKGESKSLCHLLRPELVKKFRCPLSPDAFSRMGIEGMKEVSPALILSHLQNCFFFLDIIFSL